MHMVVYDVSPVVSSLMGELTQMRDMCITYEDLIDFALLNREPKESGYEDYMADVLCDYKGVNTEDRHLVKSAYHRIRKLTDLWFPASVGRWLCCGFVGTLGYFIHGADEEHLEMDAQRLAIINTIRSHRGFYDSAITHSGI